MSSIVRTTKWESIRQHTVKRIFRSNVGGSSVARDDCRARKRIMKTRSGRDTTKKRVVNKGRGQTRGVLFGGNS